MRTLRLALGLALLSALIAATTNCNDYSFEQKTEIAVLPSTINISLKPPAGVTDLKSTFARAQHFYIENRSLSQSIRVFNLEVTLKASSASSTKKELMPLVNGAFNAECPGYFYEDAGQPFFKMEADFDLRFAATLGRDATGGIRRGFTPSKATIMRYNPEFSSKCEADPNGGCYLYSVKDQENPVRLDSLFGLNYCDQLAIRDYMVQQANLKRYLADLGSAEASASSPYKRDFSLVPKQYATYRWMASQVNVVTSSGTKKSETATGNPWKNELKLAACGNSSCEFTEFYEDMLYIQHPAGLYGSVSPSDLINTQTAQPDWDRIGQICYADGSDPVHPTYKSDYLSVEILDASGHIDEEKMVDLIKLDTAKVVMRYIREPYTTAPNDNRARCGINDAAAYDAVDNMTGRLDVQIAHSARKDLSRESTGSAKAEFVANVGVNLIGQASGFPIPVITMAGSIEEKECTKATTQEPLAELNIFGCDSESPSGNYPLEYWWEIVEKPDQAVDTQLICATCSVDDPNRTVVELKWTSECKPKIYLPLAGKYSVKLKVRDSRNIESDDANNTETCPWAYLTINVVPSKKVYVQLAWDKGDKVNKVDLDLFLAQYRECGTMGVKMPSLDKVKAPVASFPTTCQKDADCQGLPCKADNTCDTSCTSNDDCKVAHPGWICDGTNCTEAAGQVWACQTDADCLGQGYCTPKDLYNCAGNKICTLHTPRQINDSCHFENRYKVDFGQVCEPTDNVGLDIDDVDGYGPETISIAEPANGTYRAVVRLYNDVANQLSTSNPVTAYLTVYVSGEPCPTMSMVFDTELMYWKAVDIDWIGEGLTNCANHVHPVALNPANAGDSTANQCRDTNDCSALGVDPKYANPYRFASSLFDPCNASYPRSVWCDLASDPDCDTTCCSN